MAFFQFTPNAAKNADSIQAMQGIAKSSKNKKENMVSLFII